MSKYSEIASVLISDDVNQKCVEILESSGLKVTKNTKLSVDELKAELQV